MVTFDSASIDPKLFDGGKLVHATIGKEQIMSTTCKWFVLLTKFPDFHKHFALTYRSFFLW